RRRPPGRGHGAGGPLPTRVDLHAAAQAPGRLRQGGETDGPARTARGGGPLRRLQGPRRPDDPRGVGQPPRLAAEDRSDPMAVPPSSTPSLSFPTPSVPAGAPPAGEPAAPVASPPGPAPARQPTRAELRATRRPTSRQAPAHPQHDPHRPQHRSRRRPTRAQRAVAWVAVLAVVALVVTVLVLVVGGISSVIAPSAPKAEVTLHPPAATAVPASTAAISLPWPSTGQAAVAIPAVGYTADSGPEQPVPVASMTKVMTAY